MKITILRDYKEEGWQSMEVYADSLTTYLKKEYKDELTIREHVTWPTLSKYFSSKRKYMRYFFRYIVNPIGTKFQQSDIFHITDHANTHLLSTLDPRRTIVTCHDITTPYWEMGAMKRSVRKKMKHMLERWSLHFMKRAAAIIAVSEATKRDIVKTLDIEKKKIYVVPEGVDDVFCLIKDRQKLHKIQNKYSLPPQYILHIGSNYYNKNIPGLLYLLSELVKQDNSIHLVKVGEQWTKTQKQIINQYNLKHRIFHLGFVPRKDLPGIYSLASCLVQPSFTEGFGFTVLEAMACGCPVVVSQTPALRELVGQVGVYISTDINRNDIQNILETVQYPGKQKKHVLLAKKKAGMYTWKKTAHLTHNIYTQIYLHNKTKHV